MRLWPLLVAALLSVTACTQNTVIVLAPQMPRPQVKPACNHPASAPVVVPAPPIVSARTFQVPPAALQSKTSGCAGVLFRLTVEGEPYDLNLLTESPAGSGYGDAALLALGGTRFAHQNNPSAWHYIQYTLTIPPGPQLLPQQPAYRPSTASAPYNL
jgi:hypothetical protein